MRKNSLKKESHSTSQNFDTAVKDLEPMDKPDLMTVKETSQYLRIPLPTVYYLVQRGQLPAVQIGGRWRIKRDLLDRDILKKDQGLRQAVLVVEDDPALQTLYREFLKRGGLADLVVGTAREAVEAMQRHNVSLAIIDLNLPDSSGDELYFRLQDLNPEVPIVIVTGYPDSEMLNRILSSGPVTVLRKPVDFEQLTALIRRMGRVPV
jgi:excisionase family DNA binding protein